MSGSQRKPTIAGYRNCGTYRSPITVYEKTAFLAICLTPTLLLIFAANKKKPVPLRHS